MLVMSTDSESLEALRKTFAEHEAHRTRWQIADAPPAGSELARADAVWPRLPYTEHVRQTLTAAWDHFDLVRLTIDAGCTFPTGLNGVLRGGLVASAMALWLVGPEDSKTRDERGLALSDEWYVRRIRYQRDLLKLTQGDRLAGTEQLKLLESDRASANQLRTKATKVQATAIIDWAARHRYGDGTPQQKQALLEWQRLGGDAHALGWQLLLQDVSWGTGTGGPIKARVTASLSNVVAPYLCAWYMYLRALHRFDELWATPAPTHSQ